MAARDTLVANAWEGGMGAMDTIAKNKAVAVSKTVVPIAVVVLRLDGLGKRKLLR